MRPTTDKLLDRPALLTRAHAWRVRGERIVFTNGCFDLLHAGHVENLEQARRLGDRLVVGLNSDSSVQRLKGPSRPILSQHDRARLLAALEAVDAVVVFDEDTPADLIGALLPEVLVKGGDYAIHEIAGHEAVLAAGGRVETLPLVAGYSTSALVGRIRQG